jgi:hypothetical protein
MTTDTTIIERIIGGANIGTTDSGHFALVALVKNPDAAHAWLTQLSVAFQNAHGDYLLSASNAKALVDARERALTQRESNVAKREVEVTALKLLLEQRTQALHEIITVPTS